jgi:hypothetical protein
MKKYVEGQKNYLQLRYELPAHEREIVTKRLESFLRQWNYL